MGVLKFLAVAVEINQKINQLFISEPVVTVNHDKYTDGHLLASTTLEFLDSYS